MTVAAVDLTPKQVEAIAQVLAETGQAAAATLEAHGYPDAALPQLATDLVDAADRQVATSRGLWRTRAPNLSDGDR